MTKDIEREDFENHLKKMGKTDNETFSKNEDDSYQMDIIHFGWKIWQAAKAHEAEKLKGCVVVPVEPTEAMMINALAVIATGVGTQNIDFEIRKIWEKMVEAARGGK